VTVVPVNELVGLRPGPVAEVLSSLPVFSGSRVADGNPGNGATNAGANVLNLRNLGFYRTLVLFDGHRVPPSTYDQLVDVDMIPQMLLRRAAGGSIPRSSGLMRSCRCQWVGWSTGMA